MLPTLLAALAALFLQGVPLHAETAETLVKQGDVFDQKLQAADALKCYMPAEKMDPRNCGIACRIARQYRHLMADAPGKDEKLRLGMISLEYAKLAASLGPDNAEAQLSPAISYGKMMPILSAREQVAASPRIKAAADKALALDPRDDLAWHILGRWNRILADVGGVKRALAGAIYGKLPVGSNEEAARCLEKAISLNCNRLIHYIELGRIYAQMGRKDDARRMLKKGLSMPSVEKDDPEAKDRGRELLAKL
jgi:tetratricopeptide (TPR) repeat protein